MVKRLTDTNAYGFFRDLTWALAFLVATGLVAYVITHAGGLVPNVSLWGD